MVEDKAFFDILIKHPYQFSEDEKDDLERIGKKYPYFQIAKTMQLKYLKERNLPLQNLLVETAAQTIDRKVLFMYIEDDKLLFRSQEKVAVKVSKKDEAKPEIIQEVKQIDKPKDEVVVDLAALEKLSTHQVEKSVEKIVEISQKEETKTSSERIKELADKLLIDSPDSDEKNIDNKSEKCRGVTIGNKQNVIPKRNIDQKMSYLDWLDQINKPKKEKKSNIFDAIDTFLKNKPKIVPVKNKSYKAPAIIEESVAEKQMLMTETLANLYVKQKKYDKAIQAFKILSLKYPKKSSYFANRISEIKQN